MTFDFTQDGSAVTGQGTVYEDQQRDGPMSGTLSGNTLTFSFQFGANCVRTVSGSATFGADTMTGTFSGRDCEGRSIANGKMSLSIQRPTAQRLVGTTWSAVHGSPLADALGFTAWIWQFTQTGPTSIAGILDLNGSVSAGSGLPPGVPAPPGVPSTPFVAESTGPLSGTLTFKSLDLADHAHWDFTFSITLSGRCPATLSGTVTNWVPALGQLSGSISGNTCRGPVNSMSFGLAMQ